MKNAPTKQELRDSLVDLVAQIDIGIADTSIDTSWAKTVLAKYTKPVRAAKVV